METVSNKTDAAYCSDILFNGYKILIILQSRKKSNQQITSVPPESVNIARVSLTTIQSFINNVPHMYWGGARYVSRRSTI